MYHLQKSQALTFMLMLPFLKSQKGLLVKQFILKKKFLSAYEIYIFIVSSYRLDESVMEKANDGGNEVPVNCKSYDNDLDLENFLSSPIKVSRFLSHYNKFC